MNQIGLIRNKLHDKTGIMYIDDIVSLIVIMSLLLIFLSSYSVAMRAQRLNSATDEIKRMVEIDGKFDNNEKQDAESLLAKNNLVNTSIDCTANGEIQLNNQFTITVTGSGSLGVGTIGLVQIPLRATSTGFSNVYYK